MRISQYAAEYVARRHITRTPIYSANRFVRLVGDLQVDEITDDHLETFRAAQLASGLSPWSTKCGLKDIRTLVRHAGGSVSYLPVKLSAPVLEPTPLADIDAIWPHLAPWSRQLVVITLWTGLRLSDALSLQCSPVGATGNQIPLQWTASKTGKSFRWPRPPWLAQWLTRVPLPYRESNDHAQVIVRAELDRCSELAGVVKAQPKWLRQRAITEWLCADSTAGQLIHGCGVISGQAAILNHYADKLAILEAASHRLRLPESLGATAAPVDALVSDYRRLDPQARLLLSETARRLAAG